MSLRTLAIEASEELWRIADRLCEDSSCYQFCFCLKITLSHIITWFKKLPDGTDSEDEAIELLFEQLNNICQSRDTIGTEKADTTTSSFRSPYVAVKQLRYDSGTVTQAVSHFASDKKFKKRRIIILQCLDSIPSQITNEDDMDILPSDMHPQVSGNGPREFGREIFSLHHALYFHYGCPESQEMAALIKLSNNNQSNNAKVTFNVLFMVHSHGDSQPGWQDTHISIQPAVNFEPIAKTGDEILIDSDMPFCSYISDQYEEGPILLEFSVRGKKLYTGNLLDQPRQWGFDRPSISLGQLLEEVSRSGDGLTEKNKEILSWLLAKAAWQYYSSPWMNQPWNKESVHFLFEQRQNDVGHQLDGIFVNEPFLSISIAPHISEAETTETGSQGTNNGPRQQRLSVNRKPLHSIPKILALGIMLMEIQLGRSIESLHRDLQWSKYCPKKMPNQNTNYNICRDLIKGTKFFEEISDPLEKLIKNCIQTNGLFMPPNTKNEEDIRVALYDLVNQLEVYLSKRKPQIIKPLNLSKSAPINYPSPTSLRIQTFPLPQMNYEHSRPGRTMSHITNSKLTKSWLEHMAHVNYFLKASSHDAYEKVKIAVLDTGIHPDDATAIDISTYRDFVSRNDGTMCDNTGHGTTIVNLIFEMCESASVHVARIFDTDEATDETQALATEAIEWCIDQKMDVVCMACGFNEVNQELFDKIHEASTKMLIFAAPTNEGNAGEIAYPARLDSAVLCMFATNGAIANSRHLNPTAGLGCYNYNFAILGEDIKTFDTKKKFFSDKEKSGTSFSTAIAAGLVGQLLEFSRHRDWKNGDSEDEMEYPYMMKLKHGMVRILKGIAVKDGPFNCLKPWMLLPKGLQTRSSYTEADKESVRHHIRNFIIEKLRKA